MRVKWSLKLHFNSTLIREYHLDFSGDPFCWKDSGISDLESILDANDFIKFFSGKLSPYGLARGGYLQMKINNNEVMTPQMKLFDPLYRVFGRELWGRYYDFLLQDLGYGKKDNR